MTIAAAHIRLHNAILDILNYSNGSSVLAIMADANSTLLHRLALFIKDQHARRLRACLVGGGRKDGDVVEGEAAAERGEGFLEGFFCG